MAEIGHSINMDYSAMFTNGTSTWDEVSTTMTIPAVDLDGNSEYLVLTSMLVGGASTADNEMEFRVAANGTQLDFSHARVEPRAATNTQGSVYFWFDRYTTPPAPVAVEPEHRHISGTLNCFAGFGGSIALKLDDLVENSQFYWDEDLTNHTGLDNTAWTDGASITIGDGVSDYLIFYFAHQIVDNGTSNGLKVRVNVGGTALRHIQFEGEDTIEEYCVGSMAVVNAPAASTVVKNQMQLAGPTTGSNDVDCNRIIAIKLTDVFEDYGAFVTAGTNTIANTDTWVPSTGQKDITTSTGASRDWLWFGVMTVDCGDGDKRLNRRLRDIERTTDLIDGNNSTGHTRNNDTADEVPLNMFDEELAVANATAIGLRMSAQEEADVVPEPLIRDKFSGGFTFELVADPRPLQIYYNKPFDPKLRM
jgi:hypothetical protein